MKAIVFSKDRPLQLGGLLSSAAANAPFLDVRVLYRPTTLEYAACYAVLAQEHPHVRFTLEDDFQTDVRRFLDECGDELVVFFTDDDVIFREIPDEPVLLPDNMLAFSWRLGVNTTYCYPLRTYQPVPAPVPSVGSLTFRWQEQAFDFAYPMSLDGHVLRAADVRKLIGPAGRLAITNPNQLEEILAHGAPLLGRPLMGCYPLSHVVGLPVNRVTDTHRNRAAEDVYHPTHLLLENFVAGYRMHWESMDFTGVCGAHHELAIQMLPVGAREEAA